MSNSVELPQLAWFGTRKLELSLPENWQVEICHMAGYNRPALSGEEIRKVVRNPLGTPPIREAARGKKEVVIIFDDMSRVTRVAEIVPAVLEELEKAGITDEHIRFVAALGCHGAMDRVDFVKKLGEKTVSRFHVYNHNPFGNCTYVGTTSFGTRVLINSEVMKCDYKIAIGSIVPHGFAGYGGGAKIILPGVASIGTSRSMHRMKIDQKGATTVSLSGMGDISHNVLRQNIEEAAALAGLDFKIDAIVNTWGESAALFAGTPQAEFAAGLKEAQSHYLTRPARDCDIVIANTFAKVNEGESGIINGFGSLKESGGDMVLICNAPEGHVTHYLLGNWGKISGQSLKLLINLPEKVNHLYIYNEYPDLTITGCFEPLGKVSVWTNWKMLLSRLQETHGTQARVAVFPNAEIQYCVQN